MKTFIETIGNVEIDNVNRAKNWMSISERLMNRQTEAYQEGLKNPNSDKYLTLASCANILKSAQAQTMGPVTTGEKITFKIALESACTGPIYRALEFKTFENAVLYAVEVVKNYRERGLNFVAEVHLFSESEFLWKVLHIGNNGTL